jgi:CYTH domain-containing protein
MKNRENEMKFFVKSDSWKDENFISKNSIIQGYLNQDPARTVRIRIEGDTGLLTVKGASTIVNGVDSRYEFETEIDLESAKEMLEMSKDIISKTRYKILYSGHIFEVDEYHEILDGFVTVEVEVKDCNEEIEFPEWIGQNITGVAKYYNSNLIHLVNPSRYFTVKDLQKKLYKMNDCDKVFIERIEDIYFEKYNWSTKIKKYSDTEEIEHRGVWKCYM